MYGVFGAGTITWQSVSVGGTSLPLAAQTADPLGNPAAYFTPTEAVSGPVVIVLVWHGGAHSGMSWNLQQGDIDSSNLTIFQNGDFSTAPPPPPHVDLYARSYPESVDGGSCYWLSASPIPDNVTAQWIKIELGRLVDATGTIQAAAANELPPNTMAVRFTTGDIRSTSFQATLRYFASSAPAGLQWKMGGGGGLVKDGNILGQGPLSTTLPPVHPH